MKKYYYLLMAAFVAISTFSLTACGDDEEDEFEGDGSIVGTWKCDLAIEYDDLFGIEEYHAYVYSQYKEDGTLIDYTVSITKYTPEAKKMGYEDKIEVEVDRGTYKINGNKLTLTTDGETETCLYEIKGNKLLLTNTSGVILTVTCSRVSDAELNQYLKYIK